MKEDLHKEQKQEETTFPHNEKIVISRQTKPQDFLDRLFQLIMPREHEIEYPDDSSWREFVKKIVRKIIHPRE